MPSSPDLNKAGNEARTRGWGTPLAEISGDRARSVFAIAGSVAQTTSTIDLMTGIAVAFCALADDYRKRWSRFERRLPTDVRCGAWLANQTGYIEKRYSMPWSSPAARMREFVLAMRAIWATPARRRTHGVHRQILPPALDDTILHAHQHRAWRTQSLSAAVGPLMTEVAGEVADGMFAHGFTTEAYLRTRRCRHWNAASPRAGVNARASSWFTRIPRSRAAMRKRSPRRIRKCVSRSLSTVPRPLTKEC